MTYEEPTLSDYSLIGNGCAAALVSKSGSIDWCCLPEFHSPSIFAALLDMKKGGHFSITPDEEYQSDQTYLPATNVVETHFTTNTGEARILDAFMAMQEEDKVRSLFPDHEILRVVEGISGSVRMKLEYMPRIFYGKTIPELKDNKRLGIKFSWKEDTFTFISTLDHREIDVDTRTGRASAQFNIQQGERIIFSLSYSNQGPAVIPELKDTALQRMNDTTGHAIR